MEAVVLDIDETIIDTSARRREAWRKVLGLELSFKELEAYGSREIAERYVDPRYRRRFYVKFWRLLLCYEPEGFQLLSLDKPKPYAVEAVSRWAENSKILYLTGRTENMKDATVEELKSMGFPVERSSIYMAPDLEEYLGNPYRVRRSLLRDILKKFDVSVVVDDNARFFKIYREVGIPLRIGLLRPRFKPEDYMDATLVAESWKQISSLNLPLNR